MTTTRPLRKDAERNRQRILDAASEAFAEDGLCVTLDDVARRAGVGVGTVYRRFPGKEQLIDALFEDRIDAIAAAAEEALAADDAWDGLVAFFERTLALQLADRGLRELIFNTAHGLDRVDHARARIKPLVFALVERAKAEGALRTDVEGFDIPLIQHMLGALIDVTRDVEPEVYRRFLTIVLDGMRADGAANSPLPVPALGLEQVERVMQR